MGESNLNKGMRRQRSTKSVILVREHWEETTLADVALIIMGQSPPSSTYNKENKGLPFFQGKAEFGEISPTVDKYCSEPTRIAEKNDILLSVRAPVGPTNIADTKCCIGRGLAAIRPGEKIEHDFLYQYFKHIEPWFSKQGTGSTFNAIKKEDLYHLKIPLPPLDEQKRIVARLDAVLPRVKKVRERLAKIPLILKRFRQSVLAAACSGKLTEEWRAGKGLDSAELKNVLVSMHNNESRKSNAATPTNGVHDLRKDSLPDTWEIMELEKICDPSRPITYGILKPGPNILDGIPYIRVADFPNNKLNEENIKMTSDKIHQGFKRSILQTGDLLLSIRGSVGRLIFIPESLNGANITQDTARLSISKYCNSDYVYYALLSPHIFTRMQKAIKGAAIKGINIGDVRAIQIPLPPLPEQNEIVLRVKTLLNLAASLEERYNKAKTHVERIEQEVLSHVFRR